ncbi:hypothetical protein LEP1GSC125_2823 [Leptospira mayottensis 200901122]|uniref:Uncharacterized protein n=1 Tax=Leptospira mayottensis 200901122 TaxID=1193010 RepID=A0AA87MNA8_9LEPT|nr:hypothetical protein LEP1GSC125_2823 [Leptospira mayottensis 200901122]
MKQIVWEEWDLVRLKLKNDLYNFAQILCSPYMHFFNLRVCPKTFQKISYNDSVSL